MLGMWDNIDGEFVGDGGWQPTPRLPEEELVDWMVTPLKKLKEDIIKENANSGDYSVKVLSELLTNFNQMKSNPQSLSSKLFAKLVCPHVKPEKMG